MFLNIIFNIIIFFFILLFSCGLYYDDGYYIKIPELEKVVFDENLSQKEKMQKIEKWVKKNIKYELSLTRNKCAITTYKEKTGECRDQLGLMMHLTMQYFNFIPHSVQIVVCYDTWRWHCICYYKEFDLYYYISDNYFKNGKLWVVRTMSYYEFIYENNA